MKQTTKNITLSAMFLALGMVLPFLTGQIPQIGSMLLPMHIPVFLCGLICGWQYGAIIGFILPFLRYAAFGMPPLFPTGCSASPTIFATIDLLRFSLCSKLLMVFDLLLFFYQPICNSCILLGDLTAGGLLHSRPSIIDPFLRHCQAFDDP